MNTDAIVVAVRSTDSPQLDLVEVDGYKSLLNVAGRPAIERVVDSLKKCDRISRVVLVSNDENYSAAPEVDLFVEDEGTGAEGVIAAAQAEQGVDRCLVLTGDMALASPEAISDLLTYAPDADLVYPVVEKADVDEVFPGRSPYYVNAKEGRFTGSSLLLFKPDAVMSHMDILARLLNARQDPTTLLGILGAGFALKVMLGKPPLADFQNALSKGIGMDCRLFISHYPELFVSIESSEDIGLMERFLSEQ